ncbi:hypothetical protein P3342_002055 [Pyrenophora teres f. teres]|nr:hypothetical protein P3342_002055 [Pyrenophora teres f. teres]
MAGAIVRQTWILTKKTLLVVFVRQWFFTSVRAFWAPIIFASPTEHWHQYIS